jgi:hypothetical protein
MKRLIIFLLPLLFGCSQKIVYVPTETVRTEKVVVHDTTITVKLSPSHDSIVTMDTLSIIDRKMAKTTAKISGGLLTHTLEVKDIPIQVKLKYFTVERHDTTTKVMPINKADQKKIDGYDKLKALDKAKTTTIWKLIGVIALLSLWILRKPILKLLKPL